MKLNIRSRYQAWKEKPKTWKYRYSIIAGLLVLLIAGSVYLFGTRSGQLFREGIWNNFVPPTQPTVIEVYNDTGLVETFDGLYSVQEYHDHIVIFDHESHRKIEFYGDFFISTTTKGIQPEQSNES